jgi:hypothetical protein
MFRCMSKISVYRPMTYWCSVKSNTIVGEVSRDICSLKRFYKTSPYNLSVHVWQSVVPLQWKVRKLSSCGVA